MVQHVVNLNILLRTWISKRCLSNTIFQLIVWKLPAKQLLISLKSRGLPTGLLARRSSLLLPEPRGLKIPMARSHRSCIQESTRSWSGFRLTDPAVQVPFHPNKRLICRFVRVRSQLARVSPHLSSAYRNPSTRTVENKRFTVQLVIYLDSAENNTPRGGTGTYFVLWAELMKGQLSVVAFVKTESLGSGPVWRFVRNDVSVF